MFSAQTTTFLAALLPIYLAGKNSRRRGLSSIPRSSFHLQNEAHFRRRRAHAQGRGFLQALYASPAPLSGKRRGSNVSRAGDKSRLYRGNVCTGWSYRKGNRWNDYWWNDWDDDWIWNNDNHHGHSRTCRYSVARCVEINCNALHAIDAMDLMAWDSLVYFLTVLRESQERLLRAERRCDYWDDYRYHRRRLALYLLLLLFRRGLPAARSQQPAAARHELRSHDRRAGARRRRRAATRHDPGHGSRRRASRRPRDFC